MAANVTVLFENINWNLFRKGGEEKIRHTDSYNKQKTK